jgi:hypothetical protein
MAQELENRIEELEERISRIENEGSQIKFPLNKKSKDEFGRVLEDLLPDKVFNSVWEDHFYNLETFEYQETITSWGYSISGPAGVNWTNTSQPVFYLGADQDTASVKVGKYVFQNDFLSYDKAQYFRTVISLTDVTDVEADVSIGGRYGFSITNNAITGYAGTNETGTLKTLTNDEGVKLEARLSPDDKCVFKINDEERGSVLVPPSVSGNNISLWELQLTNNDAGDNDKIMFIQWFELIQKT